MTTEASPSPATLPATSGAAFEPKHKIRLVTATSLFDGHDASIHVFRRIAQATGAEVIHLGHNRSVREVVDAAIEEDAQGIAVTSYQGGHNEFFRYMFDMLRARSAGHVKVFGGGGGGLQPFDGAWATASTGKAPAMALATRSDAADRIGGMSPLRRARRPNVSTGPAAQPTSVSGPTARTRHALPSSSAPSRSQRPPPHEHDEQPPDGARPRRCTSTHSPHNRPKPAIASRCGSRFMR